MSFDTISSPLRFFEKQEFTLQNWLKFWYPKICEILEIDSITDYNALSQIIAVASSNLQPDALKKELENKRIFAVAPGIDLEHRFNSIENYDKETDAIICADGATSFLLSKNIVPNVIVSDLDGNIDDQLSACKKGANMLVHIHGDNLDIVQQHVEGFSKGSFMITTQIQPLPGTFNFLGFTDGDRALCLLNSLKLPEVFIVGYDFGMKIGKYSKPQQLSDLQLKRKQLKFSIAKSVINWCENTGLIIRRS